MSDDESEINFEEQQEHSETVFREEPSTDHTTDEEITFVEKSSPGQRSTVSPNPPAPLIATLDAISPIYATTMKSQSSSSSEDVQFREVTPYQRAISASMGNSMNQGQGGFKLPSPVIGVKSPAMPPQAPQAVPAVNTSTPKPATPKVTFADRTTTDNTTPTVPPPPSSLQPNGVVLIQSNNNNQSGSSVVAMDPEVQLRMRKALAHHISMDDRNTSRPLHNDHDDDENNMEFRKSESDVGSKPNRKGATKNIKPQQQKPHVVSQAPSVSFQSRPSQVKPDNWLPLPREQAIPKLVVHKNEELVSKMTRMFYPNGVQMTQQEVEMYFRMKELEKKQKQNRTASADKSNASPWVVLSTKNNQRSQMTPKNINIPNPKENGAHITQKPSRNQKVVVNNERQINHNHHQNRKGQNSCSPKRVIHVVADRPSSPPPEPLPSRHVLGMAAREFRQRCDDAGVGVHDRLYSEGVGVREVKKVWVEDHVEAKEDKVLEMPFRPQINDGWPDFEELHRQQMAAKIQQTPQRNRRLSPPPTSVLPSKRSGSVPHNPPQQNCLQGVSGSSGFSKTTYGKLYKQRKQFENGVY